MNDIEMNATSDHVYPRARHSLPHLSGQGACSRFFVSTALSLCMCTMLFFILVGVAVVWGDLVNEPWVRRESIRLNWEPLHRSPASFLGKRVIMTSSVIRRLSAVCKTGEIDMTAVKVAFPNWFLVANEDTKAAWNVEELVPDLIVALSELSRAVNLTVF